MPLVKITQERSKIRCIEKHKRTLAALGLRRIRHFVVHEDTPQIRGMVHLVRYLVRIEPADAVTTEGGAAAPKPKKKSAPKRAKKRAGGAKKMKAAAASNARSKARAASGARRKARTASGLNIKGKRKVPRS
jgi:large subunit ribosomal protein L30